MGALEFDNVVFGYGGSLLFDGFSASFPKGSISCIVGPNGCGKSTLAKLAMGMVKPTSGRVRIAGRDASSLAARERARLLGVLVQQQEAPMMTARELVACGRFPSCGQFSRLSREDEERIDEAQDTPIVLFDEPTSFMDVAACFDMVRLIRQVRQRGKTVIAVIHDLNLALSVADQVFVMERGRLAAQGEPTDGCVRAAIEQSFGVRLEHVRTGCGTAWVPFESRE